MGKFQMWTCPNAVKTRLLPMEYFGPEMMKIATRSQCTFAVCDDCYYQLICSAGADDGRRGGRAKRVKVSNDPKDCNHSATGLKLEINQGYFTQEMVQKHGCCKCSSCMKLIPLKKT